VIQKPGWGLPPSRWRRRRRSLGSARPQGLSPSTGKQLAFRNAVIERIGHWRPGNAVVTLAQQAIAGPAT